MSDGSAMATGHPHDAQGRALPHAWWPADRQAPGALEFVRRFCNSINRENGAERFTTSAALDRWLTSEGAPPAHARRVDLTRAIAVREILHELVVLNAERTTNDNDKSAVWRRLAAALAPVPLHFETDGERLTVRPGSGGVEALLARIGLAVAEANAAGTWQRLKACQHCNWVVYDPSKNRSARWCSMNACGGRHNAREYRRRRRSAA